VIVLKKDNRLTANHTQDTIIYKTKDIERIMGFGKNKANNLMNASTFPSTKIGGEWVVTKENFEAWLDKNAHKTVSL